MNYFEVIGPVLLGNLVNLPVLLAWLAGIVLSVLMLRRGGGKAERLLLTGCCLMFGSRFLRPFLTGLAVWLSADPEISNVRAAHTIGLMVSLPLATLDMAGIVCLVLAFWFRWRSQSSATK